MANFNPSHRSSLLLNFPSFPEDIIKSSERKSLTSAAPASSNMLPIVTVKLGIRVQAVCAREMARRVIFIFIPC